MQHRLKQLCALDLQGGRALGTHEELDPGGGVCALGMHEELDPGAVKMTRWALSRGCIFYKVDHACCLRKVDPCGTELKEGNNSLS